MHDNVLLAIVLLAVSFIIWHMLKTKPTSESLVTNSPQLISSYNEEVAYPLTSYADRIRLPYRNF